jgi:hypothetical protein
MRFRQLRRTLRSIALAGLPTIALGACDGATGAASVDASIDADTGVHSRTEMVTQPASPGLQQLINACASGLDQASCDAMCRQIICGDFPVDVTILSCTLHRDGQIATISVTYEGDDSCPAAGRRPAGLVGAGRVVAASAAGAWLARAARLEAASVHAFVALARELVHHGAPLRLTQQAILAARDEVVHTALTTALARRFGARPEAPEVAELPPRSLEAIALENAVEGCVRETWGALVAIHQAHAAQDPEVRAAMARIAEDELRHAALGWAVDRWILPRLAEDARARIESARRAAVQAVGAEIEAPLAEELVLHLGLPDARRARQLFGDAFAALWA